MTRQNQIPSTEAGEVDTALIPLWDMSNHTNGWVCRVHSDISVDVNGILKSVHEVICMLLVDVRVIIIESYSS